MKQVRKPRLLVHYLPVYGCVSTGIMYAGIGIIALLSFLKFRDGGADESSMLAILNNYLAGKIMIGALLLGITCYILWRFYEAFTDPYQYGRHVKGIARRIGIALSTIADVLIVYAAVRILLGTSHVQTNGQPAEEREMVQRLLQLNNGSALVMGIGITYLATAVVQLYYGIARGYRERVDMARFSKRVQNMVHLLAWAGYFARGVILGIIGYFFVHAGATGDANTIVNTDKAFDFIGDHVGHPYFILTAIATICYGLFMMVQGVVYDTE
jgi:hypothetical protein